MNKIITFRKTTGSMFVDDLLCHPQHQQRRTLFQRTQLKFCASPELAEICENTNSNIVIVEILDNHQ